MRLQAGFSPFSQYADKQTGRCMPIGRPKRVLSPLEPLAPPSFSARRVVGLKQFASDLRGTWKLARANQLKAWSASVAFYCLFATTPFLILCFVGSRRLIPGLGDPQGGTSLRALIETLMPSMAPLISQNLVDVAQRNLLADAFTILLIAWSTYGLFTSLHSVFENISASGKTRNFFWANFVSLLCFGVVFGGCSLFLFLTTTEATTLRTFLGTTMEHVDLPFIRWGASTLSLFCVIGSISIVYKVLPTRPIRWIFALRASFMFIACFLCGRVGFQLYVNYYRQVNETMYGAFLAFMIVVIWIYYLSRTFLFSAQYAIYLEEKERRH
jgi:membrane protein